MCARALRGRGVGFCTLRGRSGSVTWRRSRRGGGILGDVDPWRGRGYPSQVWAPFLRFATVPVRAGHFGNKPFVQIRSVWDTQPLTRLGTQFSFRFGHTTFSSTSGTVRAQQPFFHFLHLLRYGSAIFCHRLYYTECLTLLTMDSLSTIQTPDAMTRVLAKSSSSFMGHARLVGYFLISCGAFSPDIVVSPLTFLVTGNRHRLYRLQSGSSSIRCHRSPNRLLRCFHIYLLIVQH